jgi:hypothetical protein
VILGFQPYTHFAGATRNSAIGTKMKNIDGSFFVMYFLN